MKVLFNVVGIYSGKATDLFGAFVRNDAGQVYFSTMTGDGWSGSVDLPDTFRSQRDVHSTAIANNIRVTGSSVSHARISGTYRQEWCAKRGEWTLQDLVSLGKLSAKDARAAVAFYGVDVAIAA
jgi:hypothetical protein